MLGCRLRDLGPSLGTLADTRRSMPIAYVRARETINNIENAYRYSMAFTARSFAIRSASGPSRYFGNSPRSRASFRTLSISSNCVSCLREYRLSPWVVVQDFETADSAPTVIRRNDAEPAELSQNLNGSISSAMLRREREKVTGDY